MTSRALTPHRIIREHRRPDDLHTREVVADSDYEYYKGRIRFFLDRPYRVSRGEVVGLLMASMSSLSPWAVLETALFLIGLYLLLFRDPAWRVYGGRESLLSHLGKSVIGAMVLLPLILGIIGIWVLVFG